MAYYDDGLPYSEQYIEKPIPPTLRIARVIKVYQLDMCADIAFQHSMDLGFPGTSSGRPGLYGYRVPILAPFAGSLGHESWLESDSPQGEPSGYGVFCPVRPGDYVVVGFIDNDFARPVILGCVHYFFRDENITGATKDFSDEQGPSENNVTADDEDRFIAVFPSMVWYKVNQHGEIEISFPLGKGAEKYAGFFIKIGRDDLVGEAKNLVDSVVKAKEIAEDLKRASDILDLPKFQDAVAKVKSGVMAFAEAIATLLADKDVQKILSGDPHVEEDYSDGGCCCGAQEANPENPSSSCSCGANWATCPNCGAHVSGCPYRDTWTCSNCGSPVDNPNR